MKTIGLWVYPGRAADPEQIGAVTRALRDAGLCLYTLPSMVQILPDVETLAEDTFYQTVDGVISLGGDGTVLGAARDSAPYGCHVLGINLGHKGFLTGTDLTGLRDAIDKIVRDDYQLEERMMLTAHVKGRPDEEFYALNDVLVCSAEPMKMIHASAYADGLCVGEFSSDGLLVSTPTGSTGYNLSAGGPVIGPGAQVLLLTPLHAHSMRSVPLVLSSDAHMVLQHKGRGEGLLIADGRVMAHLSEGEEIHVRRAPFRAQLIQMNPGQFYELLYAKLR